MKKRRNRRTLTVTLIGEGPVDRAGLDSLPISQILTAQAMQRDRVTVHLIINQTIRHSPSILDASVFHFRQMFL